MHILCLGMNHQTARVCLRERLAFDEISAKAALSRIHCNGYSSTADISEMVILSTCNRVEVYTTSVDLDFRPLEEFLSETRSTPLSELDGDCYRLSDQEAVSQIFRVAAGLDSLVLGEPQILGQVTQAYQLARAQNAIGPILSRLFQAALHAGKRVRHETEIGQNPASIASVAIRIAETEIPYISSARIGVLGAGEMAELAVKALRKRGVATIRVVNRSLERARRLAERWNGQALAYEQLEDVLHNVDILVTSTGAPHTLIHKSTVQAAMAGRENQPLVIIDIAVPRDVDLEVSEIPGVFLMDMDTLTERLQTSLACRKREIPRVEGILAEEIEEFYRQLRLLDVVPLIAELNLHAETIRQAELEKTLRKMGNLSPEDRERLEVMTQALVKKLMHSPVACLKSEAGGPYAANVASVARQLFGLDSGISK